MCWQLTHLMRRHHWLRSCNDDTGSLTGFGGVPPLLSIYLAGRVVTCLTVIGPTYYTPPQCNPFTGVNSTASNRQQHKQNAHISPETPQDNTPLTLQVGLAALSGRSRTTRFICIILVIVFRGSRTTLVGYHWPKTKPFPSHPYVWSRFGCLTPYVFNIKAGFGLFSRL